MDPSMPPVRLGRQAQEAQQEPPVRLIRCVVVG